MLNEQPSAHRPAKQRRSQEKLERLVEAGMGVFAKKGYDQAQVSDIANTAGVSVGTFYHRFRNKKAFFLVLQQEFTEKARAKAQQFFESKGADEPLLDVLEEFIADSARLVQRYRGFVQALVTLGQRDPTVWKPTADLHCDAAGYLLTYLSRRGVISHRHDLEEAARFAIAFVGSSIAWVCLMPSSRPWALLDPFMVRELASIVIDRLQIQI